MPKITPDILRERILQYLHNQVSSRFDGADIDSEKEEAFMERFEEEARRIVNKMTEQDLMPQDEIHSEEELRAHLAEVMENVLPEISDALKAIESDIFD